jgi:signal transduction histidine kinase
VDYLTKPISPAHMAARVRAAIERSRLLREVQDLRANFTSTLVHDLRSPITVIHAYAELLGRGNAGPISERQRRLVTKIQESCTRMVGLIGEIVDLSKLEAGKLQLERQRFDLAGLARDVVERFEAAAGRKTIALAFRAFDEPCHVLADARRMDQVLTILLGNAVKFTPQGGAVTVEVARRGGDVELTVIDSGPGIAPEDLPLLFERLSHSGSSSGLGLVICRHLVEAHGGRIRAESEPGQGSRFVVGLSASG